MAKKIFISYSRRDATLVTPVVQLLRVTSTTFIDTDMIVGTRWKPRLGMALSDAEYVVVFWCAHASESAPVRDEYEQALAENKILVPVRLDQTLLPEALQEFQCIDLSSVVRHGWLWSHISIPAIWLLTAASATAGVVTVGIWYFLSPPQTLGETESSWPVAAALFGVAAAVVAGLAAKWRTTIAQRIVREIQARVMRPSGDGPGLHQDGSSAFRAGLR